MSQKYSVYDSLIDHLVNAVYANDTCGVYCEKCETHKYGLWQNAKFPSVTAGSTHIWGWALKSRMKFRDTLYVHFVE
jgi:hypothetical protein